MLGLSVEQVIAFALALIPAFTFHEFAHAFVAYRLGDSTAKNLGRLTLNPLRHLDPLGTLMVLVAGFGWAKPVPVNPANLRGGRGGMALVAVAGPVTNLVMAVVVGAAWRLSGFAGGPLLNGLLVTFISLNVVLVFFNLLPIAPLDGFKVVIGWLPESLASRWARTAQVGPLVLFGLIIVGGLIPGVDPLGMLIWGPTELVVNALLG